MPRLIGLLPCYCSSHVIPGILWKCTVLSGDFSFLAYVRLVPSCQLCSFQPMKTHSSLCGSPLVQKSKFIPTLKGGWLVTPHILLYLAKSQPFPGSQDKNTSCALGLFSFLPRTSKCTERYFREFHLYSVSPDEPLEASSTKRI